MHSFIQYKIENDDTDISSTEPMHKTIADFSVLKYFGITTRFGKLHFIIGINLLLCTGVFSFF